MSPDPQSTLRGHDWLAAVRRQSARVGVIAAAMAAAMLIFEGGKQLLAPRITLWPSHAVTVAFTALLAGLAAVENRSWLARRPRAGFRHLLAAVIVLTAAVMLVFESAKQALSPHITLWHSHLATIAFSTFLATLAAYLVGNRLAALNDRLETLVSQVNSELVQLEKSQAALRQSEEKFARAFRASPDCIVIAGLDEGGVLEVNERFEQITGYSRSEILGRTARDLGLYVDPSFRERMGATLKAGGTVRDLEYQLRRKSGEIATMQVSVELIDIAGVRCALSVHRDITAHKQLEAQLRQAQKMEAVGRLAAGIAHDFNNLLTVILWSCETGIPRLPADDPQRVALTDIQSAASRAASLTQQLLAFSRQQLVQPRVLNLNQVLADLQRMLARLIGEDITLEFAPAADLKPVRIDAGQIQQIVVNLAANARDAMPRGGKLLLETRNVYVDQKHVERHREMPLGDYVLLAMTDTGAGMDAATQARLFEPFFTTKEVGKGTGLGLATVYGIVKQNEGFIWVYSEPGMGTTFKVYFPRSDTPQAPAALEAAQAGAADGHEAVLLVEDEDALRNLLAKHLAGIGYRVITAHGGPEALEKFESGEKALALLVTDVVMPGMSGRELAEQLRTRLPDLKVLYISGYTDEAVLRHGILPSGSFFLQKPFALHVFAKKVRDILDAG